MKRVLKLLVVLILFVGISGCTEPNRTKTLLKQKGYTNIETTGYSFNCSEDDFYRTGFTAVNPETNKRVNGTVCSGMLFKNSTIRYGSVVGP